MFPVINFKLDTPGINFSNISTDFGPCKAIKDKSLFKRYLWLFPKNFEICFTSFSLQAAFKIIQNPFSVFVTILGALFESRLPKIFMGAYDERIMTEGYIGVLASVEDGDLDQTRGILNQAGAEDVKTEG